MATASSESKLRLLAEDDVEWQYRMSCDRCDDTSSRKRFWKHWKLLLAFELCQALLLLLGYGAVTLLRERRNRSVVDKYLRLSRYNVSRENFGLVNAADDSEAAEQFWKTINSYGNPVALDNRLANHPKLPPTVLHPTDPKLSLYAINHFHSLHCLYRIRNRILSEVPLEDWPRNDVHTMHCIDHIREDLMCNPDLNLYGSSNYIAFNITPPGGRQCRDLDALHTWAKANEWPVKEYWDNVLHLDFLEIEGEIHAERLRLEADVGRKIGYDELAYKDDTPGAIHLELKPST